MTTPDPTAIKHHYAGALLVTNSGEIIGQQRDDSPGIDNPGKIGTFGGTVEPGEQYRYTAWRELVEETNLQLDEDILKLFLEDTAWRELRQEWAEIQGADDTQLIELWRPVIQKLIDSQVVRE